MIEHALADASRIRATFVGEAGYGLAYGSHAAGGARPDSDLDLLFVAPSELGTARTAQLVQQVTDLHRSHRLRLDHEVAYEVKLSASVAQVEAAIALRGLTISSDGNLRVPPLDAHSSFLNSAAFKLRLVFNALTSAHVFLGGSITLYERHRSRADRSLALLSLALLGSAGYFSTSQAATALMHGPGSAAGKDYLGYFRGPALYSALQRGLARLAAERAITAIDGICYRPHPHICRKLVTILVAGNSDGGTDGVS